MACATYRTSLSDGGRAMHFTPERAAECVRQANGSRFQIRTASMLSIDADSFATANLGSCLLEAREEGLWAADVAWFTRRPFVLRHGRFPSCTVRFEAGGATVVDVFVTKVPLRGVDEFDQPIAASREFVERKRTG